MYIIGCVLTEVVFSRASEEIMLGRLSLGICILAIAASTGSVYSQEFANSCKWTRCWLQALEKHLTNKNRLHLHLVFFLVLFCFFFA